MHSKTSPVSRPTAVISPDTHLIDKEMFDGALDLQVDIAKKSELPFAVMLVDVVCVNNATSQKFMLGNIYRSLKAHKFERDFVGCLEGGVHDPEGFIRNRYGIITGDIKKLAEVHQIVAKVYRTIRESSLLKAKEDLCLRIKAGISTFPEDTRERIPGELYQNALAALDIASGNNESNYPVVFFNPDLHKAYVAIKSGFDQEP